VTELLELFRQMLRIRAFEEVLLQIRETGEIIGVVHPCVGHEAIAVGAVDVLRPTDWIGSHYRNHGHALARGCDMDALMAEMFARDTGICRGRGGSIHIADLERRFLSGNGIVGSGVPHAAGAAVALQLEGRGDIVMDFLGDGALGAGVVQETLNLASAQRLPIVFFCENNLWQDHTPSAQVSVDTAVDRYGILHRMPTEVVDGTDVLAVRACAERMVRRCRDGEGPCFVDARTYLTYYHAMWATSRENHRGAIPEEHRPADEIAVWMARDPVLIARRELLRRGVGRDALELVEEEAEAEVQRSLAAARAAPEPRLEDALEHVYAPD
jgi:TPP-dependent pyruvate/acetoin dehydrogenase alpha subunit